MVTCRTNSAVRRTCISLVTPATGLRQADPSDPHLSRHISYHSDSVPLDGNANNLRDIRLLSATGNEPAGRTRCNFHVGNTGSNPVRDATSLRTCFLPHFQWIGYSADGEIDDAQNDVSCHRGNARFLCRLRMLPVIRRRRTWAARRTIPSEVRHLIRPKLLSREHGRD